MVSFLLQELLLWKMIVAVIKQAVVATFDHAFDIVEHELRKELVKEKMKEKGGLYALIHHLFHCHRLKSEPWLTLTYFDH